MKKFTLLFLFLFVLLYGIHAQTFIYSGASDPQQINGGVAESGTINTDGETVIFKGNWTPPSITTGTGEETKAKMTLPATFDARWKYVPGTITDGFARGFSIKYKGVAHDEFRLMVDTTITNGLVIFWAHWGEAHLLGGGTFKFFKGRGFSGASITGPLIDIPEDAIAFRVKFDGTKYEVFYGKGDEGWVNVPELTVKEADFPMFGVHSDPEAMREFQVNTETGKESKLDWLKIEGSTMPNFNASVTETDQLFSSNVIIGGQAATNVFVYSGASDPQQINGGVAESGTINTDGETVVFKGNWTPPSITTGTGEETKAKMTLPSTFDARWKYVPGTITDGFARGFSIKYKGVAHDEFRLMLDTTLTNGLVIFWAHWGEAHLLGGGTFKFFKGRGFSGASITGPLIDIPEDAIAFRVKFDGTKYEVFYGKGDEGWVNVPELTVKEADFPMFGVHSDPEAMREFQVNTETGKESKLDWLKISGETIPNFNASVTASDQLFSSNVVLITGVPRLKENLAKVYPNPFSDEITIEGKGIKNITVYNILGQPVLEKRNVESSQIRMDLSALRSGYYFVKLVDEFNRATTSKIVKQ